MMTWIAFALGALWAAVARRLLVEATLEFKMWKRWRRSIYPAQVKDSETALFVFVMLTAAAVASTVGAVWVVFVTQNTA